MRKFIKICTYILILIIIAVIILPFIVPMDKMKAPVLARIEAATGRKVSIETISLSVFPNIALKAGGVRIGNPAWAGSGDMATIKELRLGVELMPLLHKQVNIQELSFDSPVILLIKNGAQVNWEFATNENGKAVPTGTVNKSENLQSFDSFIPDRISIKNGKITYKDITSGTHVVSNANITIKAPKPSEKIDVDLSAVVDGKKTEGAFEIGKPLTLMKGTPSDINTRISYEDMKISWQGTLTLINNKPILTGRLTLPEVNFASASKTQTGATVKNPATPKTERWSDERIDLSALNSADADMTIVINKLVLPKTSLSDLQISMHLLHGTLNIKTNDISAYSGIMKLALNLVSSGELGASAIIQHVSAEPLLHDFADYDKLSGALDSELKITSRGNTQRALISALDGQGSFVFKDGKLKGINIASLIRNITTGWQNNPEQSTDFSDMSGTYTIKNGVATNNDLKMNSPLLRINGAGKVDLPNWQVQYLLQPKIVASTQGQGGKDINGITVPVRVEGPLDNPRYRPDLQAALKENLRDPKQLKDTVNQFKDNLLNKDNLQNNLQNLLR